ncbi:MAG: PaaI family thioesterase [Lachnospiraceae bacterium]|nr:PaaI family thioesterase [Lachnospiraceae bacterium]
MGTFNSIDEAREYFKGDRFATENGMVIDEMDENRSVCSMILNDSHKNANGGIMGGVIYTLADFAFAVLANNIHRPTVAQQVSMNYLSAPKDSKLIAAAECRKSGKTSTIIVVNVTDGSGRDVAIFTGTGFKL